MSCGLSVGERQARRERVREGACCGYGADGRRQGAVPTLPVEIVGRTEVHRNRSGGQTIDPEASGRSPIQAVPHGHE